MELGVSWVWMGLESPRSSYSKLAGHGHCATYAGASRTRHTRAGLDHHRTGAPYARQHCRRNRSSHQLPDRLPPVHALHAGSGHAACIRKWPNRAVCSTILTLPTFTGSTNSTSGTARFRATIQSGFWIGRSGAISSGMGRVFIAVPDDAPGLAAIQGSSRPTRAQSGLREM